MTKKKPSAMATPMSFRVSEQFKSALSAAAEAERRSQANMLHIIVFDWCERNGIAIPGVKRSQKPRSAK